MLSFLEGVWNVTFGGLANLWHSVLNIFKTIYSWVSRSLSILWHDIESVGNDLANFARAVERWATSAIDNLYHLALKWVTDLEHWTVSQLNRIASYADNVYRWTLRTFDDIAHRIAQAYTDIERWVISSIWNPLFNSIAGLIHWIEHEGAYVYDLLTHPDKLVQLLSAYLWKAWLTLLRQFAIPVTTFIIGNFRAVVPDLISVAEDILTKVL